MVGEDLCFVLANEFSEVDCRAVSTAKETMRK